MASPALRASVRSFLDVHNVQHVTLMNLVSAPPSALSAAATALSRAGLCSPSAAARNTVALCTRLAEAPRPCIVLGEGAVDGADGAASGGDLADGDSALVLPPEAGLEDFVDAAAYTGAMADAALDAGPFSISFGPHCIDGHCQVFYQTPLSLAIVNIKPVLPGHVLVISRRRCPRFTLLSAAETADLWQSAQRVGAALEKHCQASSLTLAIQDGPDAGQSVPHVHVHVLPRHAADLPDNDELYKTIDATGVAPSPLPSAPPRGRGIALDPLGAALGEGPASPVSRHLLHARPVGEVAPSKAAPRGPRGLYEMATEARLLRSLFNIV